jgi:hypothetical protein
MKRLLVLAALVALALPAAALAKGPSEASLKGPGLGKTVKFTGSADQPGSSLMALADATGLFPSLFETEPDPMLQTRPPGALGPKYTIDYTVPGPDSTSFQIRQDAYPYAMPNGLTYTTPGQKIFDSTSRGGWYESPTLKETLGLPETAPAVRASKSAGFLSTGVLGAAGAAFLLAAAAWFYLRRRPRPSAA